MKIAERTITEYIYIYIADDGKAFEAQSACKDYEEVERIKSNVITIYVVFYNRHGYGMSEAFSSRELAELSLKHAVCTTDYIIEEMVVDVRCIFDKARIARDYLEYKEST